jgi:hypothetical protein
LCFKLIKTIFLLIDLALSTNFFSFTALVHQKMTIDYVILMPVIILKID